MKKLTDFLEILLKTIAVSTAFLIIAGYLDLKYYYNNFDININHYITASEILLISINQLGIVLLAVIIHIGFWLYHFNYLFDYDLQESISDGESRPKLFHDETMHRFFKSKPLKIYGTVVLGFLIVSTILYGIFRMRFFSDLLTFAWINCWIGMFLYMALLQGTRSLWMQLKKIKELPGKAIVLLVVAFIILAVGIWIKNIFNGRHLIKYGHDKHVEMKLADNSFIIPSDSTRYIGRTENYIFLWNRYTSASTIIPASEIKKITITPGRKTQ